MFAAEAIAIIRPTDQDVEALTTTPQIVNGPIYDRQAD